MTCQTHEMSTLFERFDVGGRNRKRFYAKSFLLLLTQPGRKSGSMGNENRNSLRDISNGLWCEVTPRINNVTQKRHHNYVTLWQPRDGRTAGKTKAKCQPTTTTIT